MDKEVREGEAGHLWTPVTCVQHFDVVQTGKCFKQLWPTAIFHDTFLLSYVIRVTSDPGTKAIQSIKAWLLRLLCCHFLYARLTLQHIYSYLSAVRITHVKCKYTWGIILMAQAQWPAQSVRSWALRLRAPANFVHRCRFQLAGLRFITRVSCCLHMGAGFN